MIKYWVKLIKCSDTILQKQLYTIKCKRRRWCFITEKKHKIGLTRFRLYSHELHIERGRYENVPRDERFCKCCNRLETESEYHFLLVCPLYTELRRTFYKPFVCHWPNLNKFDQLMLSTSKQVTLSNCKIHIHSSRIEKICFKFMTNYKFYIQNLCSSTPL